MIRKNISNDTDYNKADTKNKTKDLICKRSMLITFIYKFCVLTKTRYKVNFGKHFSYHIYSLGCLHKGVIKEKSTENATDPNNKQEYCHCTGDYFGEKCQNDHKGNFNIDWFKTYYFSGKIFSDFSSKKF